MSEKHNETLRHCLDKSFYSFIQERAFSGAAIGISVLNEKIFRRSEFFYGLTDKFGLSIDENTFFDTASLTKPLVTVLSVLALMQDGKISWDEKLEKMISFSVPEDKKKIRLFHLLSHTSGLPAHKPYYNDLKNTDPFEIKRNIVNFILNEDMEYETGRNVVYSDLGYILLGIIIEKKTGMSLDRYWEERIISPLFLREKLIFSNEEKKNQYSFASTGLSIGSNIVLRGLVHDDNCRSLGGVCGHAGLFGTLGGVLSLCECLLAGYHDQYIHPAYSNDMLKKVLEKRKNSTRTPGFDVPSVKESSSGHFFSKKTVGHLGYTGTSFWIDLKRKIIIVMLTNRTYWEDDNKKIKKIRPVVHDLIMQYLLESHETEKSDYLFLIKKQ